MILFLVIPSLLLLSLLAFIRPSSALILLSALLPTYLIRFSFFGLPTNFLEAAILTVFFFSFLQPIVRRQWLASWRIVPLTLRTLVALFIVSAVIGTIISPHYLVSLGILKSWIIIPLLLGWQVLAAQLFYSSSDSPAQRGKGPDTPITPLPSQSSPSVIIYSIIQSLVLSGDVVALLGLLQINRLFRIQSVYDVPNSLALFLVPLLVLSAWLSFTRHHRLFYIPSALVLAAAVIATQSASGLVAALFALAGGLILFAPIYPHTQKAPAFKAGDEWFFYISSAEKPWPLSQGVGVYSSKAVRRRTNYQPWLALLVLIFVAVSYLSFTGRLAYLSQPYFTSDSRNSISVRRQLWSISLDLIQDHPFLGVGLGTFEPAYQTKLHERFFLFSNCPSSAKQCQPPIPEFVFRDPHNWPLSFWLNTGFFGLVSFVLINVHALMYVRRSLPRLAVQNTHSSSAPTAHEQALRTNLIQALSLALFSILLFGLTDTIFWKNDLSVLYWLIFAGLLSQTISSWPASRPQA